MTQKILAVLFFALLIGCVDEMQRPDNSRSSWSSDNNRVFSRETTDVRTGVRVALVIGNSAYTDKKHLSELNNPTNDADDVSAVLKKFGFDVLTGKNLSRREMKDAIANFGRKASNAEAALFYFSGHGLQNKNQNFLMPVDAKVRSLPDVEDEGVNVNYPLNEMENAKSRVNIVMLDACRDNPFTGEFRSSGRGLAATGLIPKGTVIVYATDPGNTAEDGKGRNGTFTAGLLEGFKGSDLSLDAVLTAASRQVFKVSNGQQTPYVNGSELLKKDFYFALSGDAPPSVQFVVSESVTPQIPSRPPEQTGSSEKIESHPSDQANSRLSELTEKRKAEEVRLAELKKQSQILEQRRREAEEAARLATLAEQRRAEETRIAELNRQNQEAEQKRSFEPEMVSIPGGTFQMGSPENEKGRSLDEKLHSVTVKGFKLAKYDVTVKEFRAFVTASDYRTDAEKNTGGKQGCYVFKDNSWGYKAGFYWDNPGFSQAENHPVVCISWDDAMAYINWLNGETGKKYRLPTEAEWEYAARAKTQSARYWGENPDDACKYANVADLKLKTVFSDWIIHNCNDGYIYTAPVGNFTQNTFGLYDMLGNAWQWTCSEYKSDYDGSEKYCKNRANDNNVGRSLRGGSWYLIPSWVRSANRNRHTPDYRNNGGGFRLSQDSL